jgi:hypothetical protein
VIDGTKYLVNDTTNHMIIVPNPPPSVAASVDAQSITPVDLSKKSFVTPSVRKASKKKRPPSSSSSIVLAKHERSDSCSASDESSVIYVCAKKKNKTRTHKKMKNKKSELLDLVSAVDSGIDDEVTVVEKPAAAATLEVKETEVETQLLPQTGDFGQSKVVAEEDDESICDEEENMSDLSQNLLEDDDDE